MKIRLKIILIALIFFLNASQAWSYGSDLKKLIIKTIDSKIFDLSEQKNKVVLMVFWADWCSVCKVEMPHIDELYKKYQDQGLEVIGVKVDGKILLRTRS